MGIEILKDKVLTAVRGAQQHSHEIIFTTNEGQCFIMHHRQDCCEQVWLEEVIGDISDILDSPILIAEERSNIELNSDGYGDRQEWTFYTISTIKGTVDLRWYGYSNGYYATNVDISDYDETVWH